VRLSTYWQETLVGEVVGPDAAKGAQRLVASVPAAEAAKWPAGGPEEWAKESWEVAKSAVYAFGPEPPVKQALPPRKGQPELCPSIDLYKVGPDYETKALAAVRTQLLKAGIRLAAVLRDGFK